MSFRATFTPLTPPVQAVKPLQRFEEVLEKTFGTAPQNVVALLGDDGSKVRRAENLARIVDKASDILKARRIKVTEPASLSIVEPILLAAAPESRDELQDIWARLLAAAADPVRAKAFRNTFIQVAKQMDLLDAAVLDIARLANGPITEESRNDFATQLHALRDEVDISLVNLVKLELLTGSPKVEISPLGREFLRAVLD
jgi:hypothetical protein